MVANDEVVAEPDAETERKVVGMKCECCEAAIPETSLRLMCPQCAQSVRVDINAPNLICKLHARQVSWGAWDNQPTRTHGKV